MWGITIITLIMIILAASLFAAIGWEITIGVGTLLWIILVSLIIGAVWMVFLIVSSVGGRIKNWMN